MTEEASRQRLHYLVMRGVAACLLWKLAFTRHILFTAYNSVPDFSTMYKNRYASSARGKASTSLVRALVQSPFSSSLLSTMAIDYTPLSVPFISENEKPNISEEEEQKRMEVLAHFDNNNYRLPGEEKGELLDEEKMWLVSHKLPPSTRSISNRNLLLSLTSAS